MWLNIDGWMRIQERECGNVWDKKYNQIRVMEYLENV